MKSNKKQVVRLTESDLHNVIKESVKRVLNEGSHDIDDDTYFGGGLPDDKQQMTNYTAEKDINKIMDLIRPYIDKLCDIFNNYDYTNKNVYDEVFEIIEKFENLSSYGKYFHNNEIYN